MTGSLRAKKVVWLAQDVIRGLCKSRRVVERYVRVVYDLNLAYKVESVRFDETKSCIIVKAVDFSDEIMFEV